MRAYFFVSLGSVPDRVVEKIGKNVDSSAVVLILMNDQEIMADHALDQGMLRCILHIDSQYDILLGMNIYYKFDNFRSYDD